MRHEAQRNQDRKEYGRAAPIGNRLFLLLATRVRPVNEPASLGGAVEEVAAAWEQESGRAVRLAFAGSAALARQLTAVERGNHLIKLAEAIKANRENLARLLTLEQGKTYALALGEVDVSADFINFPAQGARRLEGDIYPSDLPQEHIWIHKVPYGVTVGIAAWNFPLALACRKIGPALTAGNVMVVKPPTVTPMAVLEPESSREIIKAIKIHLNSFFENKDGHLDFAT